MDVKSFMNLSLKQTLLLTVWRRALLQHIADWPIPEPPHRFYKTKGCHSTLGPAFLHIEMHAINNAHKFKHTLFKKAKLHHSKGKTPKCHTHNPNPQGMAKVQCRPQQPQTQTQAPTWSTYTGENESWGRPGKPSFYAAVLPLCDRALACLQGQRMIWLLLIDLTHAFTQRCRIGTECAVHTSLTLAFTAWP